MEYLRRNSLFQFILGIINYYFIISIIYIIMDIFLINSKNPKLYSIIGLEKYFPIPFIVFGFPLLFVLNTLFLSRNSRWIKKVIYLINTVVAFSVVIIFLALYIVDVTK